MFHSVYLVFPKSLFSIADLFAMCYLWVVCNEDKCCFETQRTADIRVASMFTWLINVRTNCVPIATLNQNKRTRLLCLGDAQIISDGGGGGGVNPTRRKGGRAVSKKTFFRAFGSGLQFGLKIRCPSPRSARTDCGGLVRPMCDNFTTVNHHVEKNVIANRQSKSAKTA